MHVMVLMRVSQPVKEVQVIQATNGPALPQSSTLTRQYNGHAYHTSDAPEGGLLAHQHAFGDATATAAPGGTFRCTADAMIYISMPPKHKSSFSPVQV